MPTGDSIAVIGSGVVGLTTALELRARGAPVTVYSDATACPPASLAAPALFTPYPGDDEGLFRRRTERAFAALRRLASEPGSGVSMGTLREYCYTPPASRPWLDDLLGTRRILPLPAPFAAATTSLRPHMDMLRYLPWLESQARARGAAFQTRRFESLDAAFSTGHRTVVNCAGIGAQALTGDGLLRPVHGQVLHVPNDLGLDYSLHDDAPGGVVAYIFTFGDRLVLGGTFEEGRQDRDTDRPTLDTIIDRCRNLLRLDGHPRWRDLATGEGRALAGVRPARGPGDACEHVRVEREERAGGRAVVHHYGHGRAGATLSWATAHEAADLAFVARA